MFERHILNVSVYGRKVRETFEWKKKHYYNKYSPEQRVVRDISSDTILFA